MKILLSFLIYFIQPVFWIGVIRSYLNYTHRLKRTRRDFNSAIIDRPYELWHFLLSSVVLGVVLSLFSWGTEITLPIFVILIYEGVVALSLLFVSGVVLPIALAVIGSISVVGVNRWHLFSDESIIPVQNYVLFVSAILLALGIFVLMNGGKFRVPRQFHNKRGTLVAGYPFKELTIAPMLVMVPGGMLHQVVPFYPVLNLGGHSTGLIFLPVLIGLRFTIFRHLPRLAFKKLGLRLMTLGIVGVLFAFISWQWHSFILMGLLVLLILSVLIMIMAKYRDLHRGKWISQSVNGLRIVGIEPHTPASKMHLHVGDIILDANHHKISNEEEFYEALQSHPTYCRLRILNANKRIVITGTAIFDDAPHDIGIVSFMNDMKEK